jgi:oligopeptide transport system ATP-binding protein
VNAYSHPAGEPPAPPPLLEVRDLVKHFGAISSNPLKKSGGAVQAVDGISFDIARGETLGMVGESGCGKSTAGRAIIQLHRPTSGSVRFGGTELTTLGETEMRKLRRHMQMVFQDPFASLNPKMTVGDAIAEPMIIHKLLPRRERKERVAELMELVGLNPNYAGRYAHEFSGGQRQRIGIARALAVNPQLVVCDEPVSALDVSVQAQIVNLLDDLQDRLGLTYLFIAHDLSVVRHISDRVAVMYLGKIVEIADRNALYEEAAHPYTKALLSAVPIPNPFIEKTRERVILTGDVPSPVNPPSGCHFRTRCPFAMDICARVDPPMTDLGRTHKVACHLYPATPPIAVEVGSRAASPAGVAMPGRA